MDNKQEALRQLVYEDLMEDRFAMEVPLFSRWWEVALFLLLGLILIPLAILMYSWDVLMGIFKKEKAND
jgi:hypothetical protein